MTTYRVHVDYFTGPDRKVTTGGVEFDVTASNSVDALDRGFAHERADPDNAGRFLEARCGGHFTDGWATHPAPATV